MNKKFFLLILIFISGASFLWGFVSHRNKVFPYGPLRSIFSYLLGKDQNGEPHAKELIESRSHAFNTLATLGYVDTTFDPNSHLRGVITQDLSRASPGFNLYNSRTAKSALLIDMQGRVIHEWTYETPESWQAAEVLPDGRLLVLEKDRELLLLDLRSRPLWQFEGRVHHDLDVFEDDIYVLNRRDEIRSEIHNEQKTLVDFISIVTLEGVERERIWILDLLQESSYAYLLPSLMPSHQEGTGAALDILHTNNVELMDGKLEYRSSIFTKGNILLSSRNINAIFIVDPVARDIVWLWGPGNLTFQHHPQLLENGKILLFDNGTERSRLLELDPLNRRIIWSYEARDFFSKTRGSVQRLPNGNTLVTESDTGYVFEINPAGDVVWKFANPDVDASGNRSALWRMTRYAPGELGFLPSNISPIP